MSSDKELLLKLEKRFIDGEISEEMYKELKLQYENHIKNENKTSDGSVKIGDTGFIKDSSISSVTNIDEKNYHGAPAVSGSQIINIEKGSNHVTKSGEKCPICGALVKDDYFMCKGCKKDYVCLKHQNEESFLCQECTRKEETVKEVADENRKREEEERQREAEKRLIEENVRKIESFLKVGEKLLSKNNFVDAIQNFEEALKIDEGYPRGKELLFKAQELKKSEELKRDKEIAIKKEKERENNRSEKRERDRLRTEENGVPVTKDTESVGGNKKSKIFMIAGGVVAVIGFVVVILVVPGMKKSKNGGITGVSVNVEGLSSGGSPDSKKQSHKIVDLLKDNTTGMRFVFIEGGCFKMGDTIGGGNDNERPAHEVCVDDFYLGKYEVTQGEWKKVMGNNPSTFREGDNYPVETISWNDAQEFVKRLSNQTGINYRLPREAEWEFAAKEGGKEIRFGTGNSTIGPEESNFDTSSELKQSYSKVGEYRKKTVPVNSFSANALGLYNMSGNVWELCEDWYDEGYYGYSKKDNPKGPSSGTMRVMRGGCWSSGPRFVRTTSRYDFVPGNVYRGIGLRVAISP